MKESEKILNHGLQLQRAGDQMLDLAITERQNGNWGASDGYERVAYQKARRSDQELEQAADVELREIQGFLGD